jgi:hypothetical protein
VLLGVSVVSELYRELRWDEREGLNKVEVGLGYWMGVVLYIFFSFFVYSLKLVSIFLEN